MREPGRPVPKQQAREIMGQFWSRYRDPTKKGGPTWLRFRSMVRVGADILRSSVLDDHQELYVVFEHERALWVASPEDVRRYFEQRGPGDYADVYVLPLTMDWCIAYTAEESGGNDVVLLSGDVEPFGRKYDV